VYGRTEVLALARMTSYLLLARAACIIVLVEFIMLLLMIRNSIYSNVIVDTFVVGG
jgi:hypothetical protein